MAGGATLHWRWGRQPGCRRFGARRSALPTVSKPIHALGLLVCAAGRRRLFSVSLLLMKKSTASLLSSVLLLGLARVAFAADTPPAPLSAPPTEALVIEHGKVDAAFAQGMPLLVNTSYKVQ